MQNELKEKLKNLSEKFNTELDIISLKALCNMPGNEEISFAITGILNRLMEKYPDDKEILDLLPKKEKISLEELIEVLQETYPNNTEVFTIKALSTFSEEKLKEKAIAQSLERILEVNPNDENIMEYLEIENVISKEKNPDMVFVEGGSYTPSFFNEERKVVDLYVNKYVTTQRDWEELMEKNPSEFKGDRKPVENIVWIECLKYCNKLSEKYNLKPVYKIANNKLLKIIYKDGKEEYPNLADFKKTEGYRLPTELEWEWFAFGGQLALKNHTFSKKGYISDDNKEILEIAWNRHNSITVHDVGMKKPNILGLYDILGNTEQYVYDTAEDGYLDEEHSYIYDETPSILGTVLYRSRGGHYKRDTYYKNNPWLERSSCYTNCRGFRIVRTANPQK